MHAWGVDVPGAHHHHASHGIGLTAADDDDGRHVHAQSPFQLADAPALAAVVRAEAVVPVATSEQPSRTRAGRRVHPARAPPLPAVDPITS